MSSNINKFRSLEEAVKCFKILRKEYKEKYRNLERCNFPDPKSCLLNLHTEIVDLGRRLEENGVDINMYDDE